TGGGPEGALRGVTGAGSGSPPLGSGRSGRGMPSMVFWGVLRVERAEASDAGGGGGGLEATGGLLERRVAGGIPSTVCFRIRGDDGRLCLSSSPVGVRSSCTRMRV
ncbi:MAG: hypothetical protein O7F08_04635, partial [Deltaproteobacteria bacterium]|nr:hypothetical protein [Deltaproteobacteria bacterium]